MVHFHQAVARLGITPCLSHPERGPQTAKLYNTVFVPGADGTLLGTHRKVHVVPVAEARSCGAQPKREAQTWHASADPEVEVADEAC
jgi:predicted amidohydrolase